MKKQSIYIVDDHQIIIDGLKGIISSFNDLIIAGEANDVEKASVEIERLQPDIALLDIRIPQGTEGLKLLQWVVKKKLATKVIILSMHHDIRLINDARNYGAKGYLLKNTGKDELFLAIHTVLKGGAYFYEPPALEDAQQIVFTPKEQEVIKLIIAGKSSQEISSELNISDETVKVHRRNIRSKTGTTNTIELLKKLAALGFTY
jgi:DNA-binding NarL/FixJ family response regulator